MRPFSAASPSRLSRFPAQAGIQGRGPASTGEAPFRHGELVEPCAPHNAADRTHAQQGRRAATGNPGWRCGTPPTWPSRQRPGTHRARRGGAFPPSCHPPLAPTRTYALHSPQHTKTKIQGGHFAAGRPSSPMTCCSSARRCAAAVPVSRGGPMQAAVQGEEVGLALRVLPKGGDGERGVTRPSRRSVMRTRCSAGPRPCRCGSRPRHTEQSAPHPSAEGRSSFNRPVSRPLRPPSKEEQTAQQTITFFCTF